MTSRTRSLSQSKCKEDGYNVSVDGYYGCTHRRTIHKDPEIIEAITPYGNSVIILRNGLKRGTAARDCPMRHMIKRAEHHCGCLTGAYVEGKEGVYLSHGTRSMFIPSIVPTTNRIRMLPLILIEELKADSINILAHVDKVAAKINDSATIKYIEDNEAFRSAHTNLEIVNNDFDETIDAIFARIVPEMRELRARIGPGSTESDKVKEGIRVTIQDRERFLHKLHDIEEMNIHTKQLNEMAAKYTLLKSELLMAYGLPIEND